MMEEQVFCFPAELLGEHRGRAEAFHDETLWARIASNLRPLPRARAETDYQFKQVVVYVIIRSRDLYLTYRRTPKTQEQRLRGEYSIGIGGHFSRSSAKDRQMVLAADDASAQLNEAVRREVREEIEIEPPPRNDPRLVCFVNDDSDDVGKVHFGTVWLWELNGAAVRHKGESGIGSVEFRRLCDLQAEKPTFERWSQLVIDFLAGGDENGSTDRQFHRTDSHDRSGRMAAK